MQSTSVQLSLEESIPQVAGHGVPQGSYVVPPGHDMAKILQRVENEMV